MELILDASSRTSQLGLSLSGQLLWCSESITAQEHTRRFMSELLRGMRQMDTVFPELRLIVVALGPGPFNGLRVAVSTAKGLAVGTGAAIVGIPTLKAEAARCRPDQRVVRPVVHAGRSNFTTALYQRLDNTWLETEAVRHLSATDLAQSAEEHVFMCGEIAEYLAVLAATGVEPAISPAVVCSTRMESLALLGWKRFCTGADITMAVLQPLYVNPPHITTPKDRRP